MRLIVETLDYARADSRVKQLTMKPAVFLLSRSRMSFRYFSAVIVRRMQGESWLPTLAENVHGVAISAANRGKFLRAEELALLVPILSFTVAA